MNNFLLWVFLETFDELMAHFDSSRRPSENANLATSTTSQSAEKQEPISVTVRGEKITLFADK